MQKQLKCKLEKTKKEQLIEIIETSAMLKKGKSSELHYTGFFFCCFEPEFFKPCFYIEDASEQCSEALMLSLFILQCVQI